MAELVDPNELRTVADLAKEFGFHTKYFSQLAANGKLRAWKIGPLWVSTREHVRQYLKASPGPGRPKKSHTQ